MITRELIDVTVERLYRHYEYMASVDEQVSTCGYGGGWRPEWHIYRMEDFNEICDMLGVKPSLVGNHHYAITYNGVYIFCIK